MNRTFRLAKKWVPLILRGLTAIPLYLQYWGFLSGLRRLGKLALAYGIVRLQDEFSALKKARLLRPLPLAPPDYIIQTHDYVAGSAGVRCLFKLADDLRLLGFSTAVTGCLQTPPNYLVPRAPVPDARKYARAGAWVIYAETIYGNPLAAKNTVRWVLNRPGFLGGDSQYSSEEQVFVYSDFYRAYVKNEVAGKLNMPMLDLNLFFPPDANQSRSLACYYVGKSTFIPNLFDVQQTFEITRQAPARSELGKLFRSSRVLYCFDNSTALIYEALLCGCPVIVIPDGTQTWLDFQKLELGTEGILWGIPDTIPPPFDPTELRARVNRSESAYMDQLRALVKHTQTIAPTGRLLKKANLRRYRLSNLTST